MNLQSMTKEQKQLIFLIAMLTFGGIYALYRFVMVPSLATFRESKAELADLRGKLDQADLAISRVEGVRRDLAITAAELGQCREEYIPPLDNSLTWATEYVYRRARALGLAIQTVDEVKGGPPAWGRSEKNPRVFVPYTVRVVLECGYFELVQLLEEFEKGNPYICITSIMIGAQQQTPRHHRVNFQLEWPSWGDAAAQDMIRDGKKLQVAPVPAAAPAEEETPVPAAPAEGA